MNYLKICSIVNGQQPLIRRVITMSVRSEHGGWSVCHVLQAFAGGTVIVYNKF